jgi:peptidoglycan/LPS O-acetylase OafA/YrhL
MEIKRFAKLSVLLPIVIGLITGAVLFWLGSIDDAPGLSLIGLATAFFLIMCGIYNAGVIKKGFLVPTLLLSFGAGGIFVSVLLLFDGEFEDNPGMALIGVALGLVLICFGAIMARKRHGKKQ